MAMLAVTSILSVSIFILHVLALQVAPNSPCASICLDDPSQDVSDPNSSNTVGADIVCSDSDYANSTVGQKYVSCLACLQGSVASSDGESDQGWFLYNLRYALNSCLFDASNGSTAISTPCSSTYSCGNLEQAISDGNLVPGNETEFSYCSADNNALLSAALPACISCLQDAGDEKYLANFLIALQAGCMQRPSDGTAIGLQGNIFSDTPVNITALMIGGTTKAAKSKIGVSQATQIGIAVAGISFLVVAIASLFVCYRKHQNIRRVKRMTLPLDPRFGASNISAPNRGAYGNPYSNGTMANDKLMESSFIRKNGSVGLASLRSVLAKQSPKSSVPMGMKGRPNENSRSAGQPPTYNEAMVRSNFAHNASATSVASTESAVASKASKNPSSAFSESSSHIQEKPRQAQQERPRKALQERPRNAQHTTRPQAKQIQPPTVQQTPPPKQQQPSFKLQQPPLPKVRDAPRATAQQIQPSKAQYGPHPTAKVPQAQTAQAETVEKDTSTPQAESQARSVASRSQTQIANMRRSTIGRGIGNANASAPHKVEERTDLSQRLMLDLEQLDLKLAEHARQGTGQKPRTDLTPKSASDAGEQWPGCY